MMMSWDQISSLCITAAGHPLTSQFICLQAYKDKLIDLQLLTRDLYERVRELEERPKAQEAMKGMLNYTRHFLVSMRNYTGEDLPFTQVEYDTLAKLINSTAVSHHWWW